MKTKPFLSSPAITPEQLTINRATRIIHCRNRVAQETLSPQSRKWSIGSTTMDFERLKAKTSKIQMGGNITNMDSAVTGSFAITFHALPIYWPNGKNMPGITNMKTN